MMSDGTPDITVADGLQRADRATLSDATNELLELAVSPAGDPIATVHVIAHNENLLGPFLTWAAALKHKGVLSLRHHEIVALRTAHNCDSPFEWAEHTHWALDAGLTPDEINAVAVGPGGWEPTEAALIQLADELHHHGTATDATIAAVVQGLDEAAAVEALFVVGQYSMLSALCAVARLTEADAGTSE